jgi:hypothetical protein
MACLPHREGLDGHQEGENAGACRRNNDREHEQRQSTEDEDDLSGWRKLLEFLQEFFGMHGFPFLSISDILRQISWCRPLTGGPARSSRTAMLEKSIAVLGRERVVLVVQKGVLVAQMVGDVWQSCNSFENR